MAALICAGCVRHNNSRPQYQLGESVVCIGQKPAHLAHALLPGEDVHARSTYQIEPGTVDYIEGTDFILDRAQGTLTRTAASRIPDFRTNMLYGKESFDHSQFPGYGNAGFFVFVDYMFDATNAWPSQPSQIQYLERAQEKLQSGEALKIVAFGDSITAGGNATRPGLIFWQRWADMLQRKYPHAQVTAVNGATGGDTTVQGLARLQAKVLDQKPDLVLIGFGMNDNNIGSVPLPEFKKNLEEMISRIRASTAAEIILYSAFPPNPKWKFGSRHMADYAAATKAAAGETHCAYADVFDNWQSLAAGKKPEDLLGNNINHPNDFGHWIYFRVLSEVGL
jgi:lysophospholipase L1-like esterase